MLESVTPIAGHEVRIYLTEANSFCAECVKCGDVFCLMIENLHRPDFMGTTFWEYVCDGNKSNDNGPTNNDADVLRSADTEPAQEHAQKDEGRSDTEVTFRGLVDGLRLQNEVFQSTPRETDDEQGLTSGESNASERGDF
jgi:hypothetical protein